MRKFQAVPPQPQQHKSYVSSDLSSCTHVFARHDVARKPLQCPYDGPYKVLKRSGKHFTVLVKGRNEVISLDRLKPAYLDVPPPNDLSQSTAPPPSEPNVQTPPVPVNASQSGRRIRPPVRLNL